MQERTETQVSNETASFIRTKASRNQANTFLQTKKPKLTITTLWGKGLASGDSPLISGQRAFIVRRTY